MDAHTTHYRIERELADRLRAAPVAQRRRMYSEVYTERSRRITDHPLVVRAANAVDRARAARPQVRLLRPFLTSDATFLEVGSGDGGVVVGVAPVVRCALGLDVTPDLVRQTTAPSAYAFVVMDGLTLPLRSASVDVAYSNQMMEHLHPDDATDQLRSIYDVLIPGGVYVCVTPNALSGPHDISRQFDTTPTGFHLKEYTTADLLQVFRAVGFERVRVLLSWQGWHLTPELPPAPFVLLERALAWVPHAWRQRVTSVLAAIKVVAYKGG